MDISGSILKVTCGDTSNGTAFLIDKKFAITAYHVVAGSEHGEKINLKNDRFNLDDVAVSELITDKYKKMDFALLEVSGIEEDLSLINLALSENFPKKKQWEASGYLFSKGGEVHDIVAANNNIIATDHMSLNDSRFKYDITLSVEVELSSYEGMSGAPILIDGFCYGFLTDEFVNACSTKEVTALTTRQFKELLLDAGIKLKNKEILNSESNFEKVDQPASDQYIALKKVIKGRYLKSSLLFVLA